MTASYDYIIIGAGSSGCVLAERLSRNPSIRVLLLEAGGRDSNPMIHIPLGATALQRSKFDWCYETEPEPGLNDRRIPWPRGKVLGGSSCLNGMIYIRGQREDYDAWAAAGNAGWSYEELLPYFRRHENNSRGDDDFHGVNGPLWVGDVVDHLPITERFARHIARYLLRRRGLLSFPSAQVGAFFNTSSSVERPDAQIHFAPAAARYNDKGVMIPEPGFTATVCHLRPTSRGSVHVRSARPDEPPAIRANYLSTAVDREASIAAVKTTRAIFRAPCLKAYGGHEMIPGDAVEADEDILAFIRNSAVSVYHPAGSCKMGGDARAVVDAKLRVRGLTGLRVADASILPTIVSGNTHAVCVVIADKCADMVLEDLALTKGSNSP